MAIFINSSSNVIVQGITGGEGSKHTARMLRAGTNIVGGVNPRKAGEFIELEGQKLPIFATVADAISETGGDVTVGFVPPAFTKASMIEAIDSGIPLAVVITEGVPVHDTTEAWAYNVAKGNKTRIIGPNCPGLASPGQSNVGIIPADITPRAGSVWSRSPAR